MITAIMVCLEQGPNGPRFQSVNAEIVDEHLAIAPGVSNEDDRILLGDWIVVHRPTGYRVTLGSCINCARWASRILARLPWHTFPNPIPPTERRVEWLTACLDNMHMPDQERTWHALDISQHCVAEDCEWSK